MNILPLLDWLVPLIMICLVPMLPLVHSLPVERITEMVDYIGATAASHSSCFVVEVMVDIVVG